MGWFTDLLVGVRRIFMSPADNEDRQAKPFKGIKKGYYHTVKDGKPVPPPKDLEHD